MDPKSARLAGLCDRPLVLDPSRSSSILMGLSSKLSPLATECYPALGLDDSVCREGESTSGRVCECLRRQTLAPTLTQVITFLKVAREAQDRFEALYVVALFTGMRPGELLALRWSDLVLDGPKPKACVRRGLLKDDSGRHMFKRTMTDKGRSVSLMPQVVEALSAHRRRQAEERLRYSGICQDQDLVFSNKTGSPMDWDNLTAQLRASTRSRWTAREHPLLRPAAHLRHAHAGVGRKPQGCPGNPRPLTDHARHGHLLPRHPQHAARRFWTPRRTLAKIVIACDRRIIPLSLSRGLGASAGTRDVLSVTLSSTLSCASCFRFLVLGRGPSLRPLELSRVSARATRERD
jgi:hypothetical protein